MSARIYVWPRMPPLGELVCRRCGHLPATHRLRMVDGRLVAWCSACWPHAACASRRAGDGPGLVEDMEEG